MGKMIGEKRAKFNKFFVAGDEPKPQYEPLVFTAGGGLCKWGRTFFSALCKNGFKLKGEQSVFRKRTFGRLSIALLSFSASLNRQTASSIFA